MTCFASSVQAFHECRCVNPFVFVCSDLGHGELLDLDERAEDVPGPCGLRRPSLHDDLVLQQG